jgi:hypothetical protein
MLWHCCAALALQNNHFFRVTALRCTALDFVTMLLLLRRRLLLLLLLMAM